MKANLFPRLLTFLCAVSVPCCTVGCVQSTTYKPGPDGSKEVIQSYGLSERAGAFADAYARYRLRLPQPVNPDPK